MSKLVIKRSQWLHGEGGRNSYLQRSSDSKMCCLGFLGVSLGATTDQLTNVSSPIEIPRTVPWTDGLFNQFGGSSEVCKLLMAINDDPTRTDAVREKQLTELFSQIGIEVEFVD